VTDPIAAPPPSRDSSLGYRPALDGMRAVAVVAVIAYHFGYGRAQGGFLGVDVFFVLSGYLITSLLLAEHARSGRIDLVAFWLRRARRLLPALLLMLAVVAFWIGANTVPFALGLRREDLLWTLFYGANWHFIAAGQDYFAQLASASPLRHTWSLAIEEQFYLAWPLIVGLALWLGRRRRAVVGAVCAAGILGSVAAMALLFDTGDPSRAYYGTDARMHELLVGGLLAVLLARPSSSGVLGRTLDRAKSWPRLASVATVVAGVALLAAFTLLSDSNSIYYRGGSLAVSVAAAAVIWGVEVSPRSMAARLLSLPPAAWIGRLSYGLYLWHWPITLAVSHAWGPFRLLPGSLAVNGQRLAMTFAAAVLSFYILEQPLRRGTMPVIGASMRRFAAAVLVAIVAVGGLATWQTASAVEAAGYVAVPDCPNSSICLRWQGPAGAPVVAVLGDSISRSLDSGFLKLAQDHGWTYVLDGQNACRVSHLLSVSQSVIKSFYWTCYDQMPGFEKQLIDAWNPQVIVVADRSERIDLVHDGAFVSAGTKEHSAIERAALDEMAVGLTARGARVALMDLPPVVPYTCVAAGSLYAPECRIPAAGDPVTDEADGVYRQVSADVPGVISFSITDAVCPGGICTPIVNGMLMRYDGLHFSQPAVLYLAPVIYERLQAAGVVK
jgi:peptidoglycan/LPS O-acetylase OafA/YrhL